MEIGVRKASGASKSQLFIQFIGESIFISMIALFFAIGFVLLVLPYLNQFSQRQLDFPLFSNPILLLNLILGAVVVGVLSGTYPAFYLSNFRPAKVLKGSPEVGNKKSEFRNALVVVQFAGAVFLIITTLFATQQIRFMQEKDLGFSHEQVLTIPLNQRFFSRYESMKQELLSNPAIEKVTGSGQRLGNNLHQTGIVFRGDGPERILSTSHIVVDPDYLDVYQIDLIAGRDFDQNISSDNGNAFIINESLAKELLKSEGNTRPIESLIGQPIGLAWMDSVGQIVGISKDFNFNSLHHKIESLAIFNKKDWGYSEVSVKIKGDAAPAAIAHIESVWDTIIPEEEFQYKFLDDHFNEMYRSDQTLNTIVGMLTLLSILISCLGLFGLVSFTTEQRVKEIGIRKVLGASVGGVVAMLSKDFMKLILAAILIAIPISWYVVDSWIQDFAYRIAIEWWVFLLAGMIAIVIALATVSSHAFKAAMMNPVDSLKSE
jgi:putative ABC transport system permease protein